MPVLVDRSHLEKIKRRFFRLYGDEAERCVDRLLMMAGSYGVGVDTAKFPEMWNEKDVLLITYGDSIRNDTEAPLAVLKRFCSERLKGAIKLVHILPFCPWSSDDGFSVKDYRAVDKDLGDWLDVENLGAEFDLMFDLVLNHCSSKSSWFKQYTEGILPYSKYFKEASPEDNLSKVVRPRTLPLLTKVPTRDGDKHVWTTFSPDQVDLDWENPDVFFDFLDILINYISKGARFVRLDAIAFLWKTVGTKCIHLKETHEVVKLFRDILDWLAPEVVLLTETNVPNKENLSYFGRGNEAHMVYQFSLPPLLLHGLLSGSSKYLHEWAKSLPSLKNKCTFLNFTSSHDGIGVRPLQGLVPDKELDVLVKEVKKRKGLVSFKSNPDGSKNPYELNITYFAALSVPGNSESELGIQRFLTSQYIAASFKGVPAVYIHCLTATPNDLEGVEESGMPRRINRKKWDEAQLDEWLSSDDSVQRRVFDDYVLVLRRRSDYPAFHPDADQRILDLGEKAFGLVRRSIGDEQMIYCLSNFTGKKLTLSKLDKLKGVAANGELRDIISGLNISIAKGNLVLKAYQTVWLVV